MTSGSRDFPRVSESRDFPRVMHQVSGRVVALSVRAAIIAGAWIGFGLGVVTGALLGAALAWFAGAILSWQRELGLTLGVTEQLLPFGSQIPVLQRIQSDWFIVVPFAGLLVGLFAALVCGAANVALLRPVRCDFHPRQ